MAQTLPSFAGLFDIPPTLAALWSARAIYSVKPEPFVDVLHDRQCMYGNNMCQEARDLCDWLNKEGIKGLQAMCKQLGLGQDESRIVSYTSKGFIIQGTPNASYGYLYIVAYRIPSSTSQS